MASTILETMQFAVATLSLQGKGDKGYRLLCFVEYPETQIQLLQTVAQRACLFRRKQRRYCNKFTNPPPAS